MPYLISALRIRTNIHIDYGYTICMHLSFSLLNRILYICLSYFLMFIFIHQIGLDKIVIYSFTWRLERR